MSQMTEPVIQLLKGKNFAYLATLEIFSLIKLIQ
jgi:hypothetical protein